MQINQNTPLNIQQFNLVTGGRSSIREDLLDIFFLHSSECLSVLEKNCVEGADKTWESALHELEGLSKSIGAQELSELCAISKENHTISSNDKKKTLANIRVNMHRLRSFLRNISYN